MYQQLYRGAVDRDICRGSHAKRTRLLTIAGPISYSNQASARAAADRWSTSKYTDLEVTETIPLIETHTTTTDKSSKWSASTFVCVYYLIDYIDVPHHEKCLCRLI